MVDQENIDTVEYQKKIGFCIDKINKNWQEIINKDLNNIKEIWSDSLSDKYIEKIMNLNNVIEKINSELEKIQRSY